MTAALGSLYGQVKNTLSDVTGFARNTASHPMNGVWVPRIVQHAVGEDMSDCEEGDSTLQRPNRDNLSNNPMSWERLHSFANIATVALGILHAVKDKLPASAAQYLPSTPAIVSDFATNNPVTANIGSYVLAPSFSLLRDGTKIAIWGVNQLTNRANGLGGQKIALVALAFLGAGLALYNAHRLHRTPYTGERLIRNQLENFSGNRKVRGAEGELKKAKGSWDAYIAGFNRETIEDGIRQCQTRVDEVTALIEAAESEEAGAALQPQLQEANENLESKQQDLVRLDTAENEMRALNAVVNGDNASAAYKALLDDPELSGFDADAKAAVKAAINGDWSDFQGALGESEAPTNAVVLSYRNAWLALAKARIDRETSADFRTA